MAKMNFPHTKCETDQTYIFLTGLAIFSYTQLENLAQVYRVNPYIIYVIDMRGYRGEGDTVASQSLLAISYISGTHYSEENARKYDRNDDTRLYCSSTSRGSAAHDKCCQYESTMRARCSCSASHHFYACSMKQALLSELSLAQGKRRKRLPRCE